MNYPHKTVLAVSIAAACASAYAQEAPSPQSEEAVLDTVVVSARGFDERTLDAPISVSFFDANRIETENLITVEDIFRSQPSSYIHNGGNVAYSFLSMRGSGSLSITSLDDNSVDFRIDGISNGKTGLARNLIDIESVEVAKGPQGTILGSKAEAGIYIIKTNDPEDEFGGHIGIGIGNDSQKSADAVLNLPVSDNIAMRIAGMTERQDNYLIRKEDNKPLNTKKKQGIQAKIAWHDDDYTTEAVLGAYHDQQTNNVPLLQRDFDSYRVETFHLPHDSKNTAQGTTLSIKRDFDFATFTSDTGYHKYTGHILRPSTPPEVRSIHYDKALPAPLWPLIDSIISDSDNNHQRLEDDYSQISQEFRLSSNPEDDIKWVAGLYLEKKKRTMHNDGKVSLDGIAGIPLPPPLESHRPLIVTAVNGKLRDSAGNGDFYKKSDTVTQAIFGEITYPATSKLDIIAGARVTHTKLEHTERWKSNANNATYAGEKSMKTTLSKTALTGRLGLNYEIQPNWHVYGLQSRGHQFGVFDDYNTNLVYGNEVKPYKSTVTNATEIGTKFANDDETLQFGVSLFYNDIDNARVKIGGLPPLYDTKSGNVDATSRGVEINALWQATDNLELYGDAAYTKTRVTAAPQNVIQQHISNVGYELPQVPRLSTSIGIRYQDDTSLFAKGKWFADVNYRHVGSRYGQANNVQKLDSYGLLNASIGIGNDNHNLQLWGKNLTDEKYLYIGVQPANVGTLAPGRTFGVKYRYQF